MYKGRNNPKGEADSKFLPAMFRSLAENFGVDGEMTKADKVAFHRAFMVAAARNAGAPVSFVDGEVETAKGRKVKVRAVEVPASVAFKLTDDSGAMTDIAKDAVARIKSNLELEGKPIPGDDVLLKRAGALKVKCVGGRHGVFGKVPSSTDIANTLRTTAADAGLMPAPKPRESAAKSAKFSEALGYVVKCLDSLGSDEPEIALAAEGEKLLRDVAERIAAYFAK
jgi:hypothetical protein